MNAARNTGSQHRSRSGALTGRGTDQDLDLKLGMRRLLWRMGSSARLDVRLRAYLPQATREPAAHDLTDLDVLGIGFTPAGQIHTTFADCRSSDKRAIERMFWVRGVADFVDADDAYLVRGHDVPGGVRTMSARLGIGILTPDDLVAAERTMPSAVNLSGPLAILFDSDAVANHLNINDGLDRKLNKLTQYLDFDYWVYDPHRNMTHLVGHLQGTVATLDPTNPAHRALFYDIAWHYTYSIVQTVAFVRATRISDVPTAVRLYVGGGELALREKTALARMLSKAGLPADADNVDPPYLKQLTELVTRFLVRPNRLADTLRYAEYLAVSEANRVTDTVATAFGDQVDPVAAKLLADTCGFLVTAASLRPDFRIHARARLVHDLTGGDFTAPTPGATEGEPAAGSDTLPFDQTQGEAAQDSIPATRG